MTRPVAPEGNLQLTENHGAHVKTVCVDHKEIAWATWRPCESHMETVGGMEQRDPIVRREASRVLR